MNNLILTIPVKRECSIALLSLSLILLSPFAASANIGYEYQLENKAGSSKELYVEPGFTFNTFKTVSLDISIVDAQGNPVSAGVVMISQIPEDVQDLSDQGLEQKALITVLRSDAYGRIYQGLELSNSVKKVLIELNIQSQNNKLILELDNNLHINHLFEVE